MWRWYRESGKLMQTGGFKNGVQTGPWTRYDASGKLYDVRQFTHGKVTATKMTSGKNVAAKKPTAKKPGIKKTSVKRTAAKGVKTRRR